MAAPEYVPRPKAEKSRVYESPPWADDSWYQDRPAEIMTGQPSADFSRARWNTRRICRSG